MRIVSFMRGLARGAGAGVRARAGHGILPALALGMAAVICAPSEGRADSGNEWLKAAFAKSPSSPSFERPRKLGAYLPDMERRPRRRTKGVRTASLGKTPVPSAPSGSATGGGGIHWKASASCLDSSLRAVIAHVAANYGKVRVNSTCRSRKHNRRVGGAPRSYHLSGKAADIRVFGNVRATFAYLRTAVGGLKHYGGGLFHIDTGPRRRF